MKQNKFHITIIALISFALAAGIAFASIYVLNPCPVQVPCPAQNVCPVQMACPAQNVCPAQMACPAQNACPSQVTSLERDRRVLSDPLYPALNRTDEQTFMSMQQQIHQGNLYQNDRDSTDSFRLVGYLSSSESNRDAGSNNWKVMARMKDRQQGEYYIIPANNNIDLKIPLTADVVAGERLRDIYSLPREMSFRSPMLNHSPYTFTEIPKGDLGSSRYM